MRNLLWLLLLLLLLTNETCGDIELLWNIKLALLWRI